MIEKRDVKFLQARYTGIADDYARFIEKEQLMDEALWKKFVQVFVDHSDTSDDGWRGEYWGKMMRGACMTYFYTRNEKLYCVLETAVKNLLSVQDEYGRFSAYEVEHEFRGWDIWGRKYVLVGLEYFYGICHDETLKARILTAMCRHADYIVKEIGSNEGQIAITDTSEWWGGINSCSILEPILELYKLTDKADYLGFAEYIISTGGCSKANLIELISQGGKPFEFPVTKAYEMMSFFEGLIAYYEVTGKSEYLETVKTFARTVFENDITIIGCAGCTHELFDHAVEKQTEYSETIMQETCVTVTWMRLLARLWESTLDARYLDCIEQSALNALYGSINTQRLNMFSFEKKMEVPPLPFDSYSPLYNNIRGRGVGGFKEFTGGGNYGCCACIGAAGTALYPLYAFAKHGKTLYVNFYLQGEFADRTPSGQNLRILCKTNYPSGGEIVLTLKLAKPERFGLSVRIPAWCEGAEVKSEKAAERGCNGYLTLDGEWQDGEEVKISLPSELKVLHKNGKSAFVYGALVLARDEEKEDGEITEQFLPVQSNGKLSYVQGTAEKGEQVRISLKCDGGKSVLLTDYASCGKNWSGKRNRISVWLNAE